MKGSWWKHGSARVVQEKKAWISPSQHIYQLHQDTFETYGERTGRALAFQLVKIKS